MARDPLSREYGIILAVTGPTMMEKAHWYREMAKMIRDKVHLDSPAAGWLDMQADRAEETVVQLARKFDGQA